MMILRSLRQHWPSRKLEWIMSGFMGSWGTYVLLHPQIFTNAETAALLSGLASLSSPLTEYPALLWGGAAFLTGLSRGIALFINGAYTRTPLVRVITSFVSMFILTQIVIGMWRSGVPNLGLVVYPWIVVADLLCAYRAAVDVVHAEKERHEIRESRRVDRSHSIPA